MYLEADTLDDLMHLVFDELLTKTDKKISSTKGDNFESVGNLLVLNNPRARISKTETRGKAFSAIGELLWYLSKSNRLEFVNYYIPEYKKYKENDSEGNEIIYGGYGPRLFAKNGHNQIENVLDLLKRNPATRKAVIQIYDAEDIVYEHKDTPCTCTLQFFTRDDKIHMYTTMRSNDAFLGLPHDIFAFTMLQEIIARTLGKDVGKYYHSVGSLHIYERNIEKVKLYLHEGWQSTKQFMPEMPNINPWPAINEVLELEAEIRKDIDVDLTILALDDYWKDIIRLLQIHTSIKRKKFEMVEKISSEMRNKIYITYIKDRINNGKRRYRNRRN